MSTTGRVLVALALLSFAPGGALSAEGPSSRGAAGRVTRMALGAEPGRPSIPYDHFLNGRGDVVDSDEFQAWARRAENLEAVYADARGGDARALRLVRYLELTFEGAGERRARGCGAACLPRSSPP